ncbi:hypothetical protein T484DRAFT_1608720, partial [Baffinella frigidus]
MVCVAGYTATSDGEACRACEAGTYKFGTGSESCETCPLHTNSEDESDEIKDCVCVAGYTAALDGVACTACEAGTYKALTGAHACLACPAGTSSDLGSDALDDCKCLAGYRGTSDGAACSACEAGGFKSVVGTGSCTACPSHTSSSEKSDEVTDCVCVAGYTVASDRVACTACEAGTYKAATGAGECSTCPAGTSSALGSDALDDCKCLVGYRGTSDGAACTACEAGTFKSAAGAGECSTCPPGTNSVSESDEVTDCQCLAGYTAASDGLKCGACETGAYKVATGAGSCTACPSHTSSSEKSDEVTDCCSMCPAGTSSALGSDALDDCKCLAGYRGTSDGAACNACEAGMFKSVGGT